MPKEVRNSVLATVLGGLILAFILWLIPGLWPWVKSAAVSLYDLLISRVAIPVWLLAILILVGLPTLILIIILIVEALKSRQGPTWIDYVEDRFDGMIWRWHYDSDFKLTGLQCYCPVDDTLLVHSRGYQSVSFRCETCNKTFGPFEGELDYNLARIARQIGRKIRTGEWKQRLKDVA